MGSTGGTATLYNQVIGSGKYYTQDEFSNEDYALGIGDTQTATGPKVAGCIQREELPTASFTAPSSPTSGVAASFNGSASSDSDSTAPLTYSWNWGDFSANGSGATPSHTFALAGVYSVTLTVTDVDGWSSSATHSVTVTPVTLSATSFKALFGVWYYILPTKNLQPGKYVVTVLDQSNHIASFSEKIKIVPED